MRDHHAHRSIGAVLRRVLIDVDAVIAIVERLQPVVVELEVPGIARGLRARDSARESGTYHVASEVHAELRQRLDARRKQVLG